MESPNHFGIYVYIATFVYGFTCSAAKDPSDGNCIREKERERELLFHASAINKTIFIMDEIKVIETV